MMKLYGVPLSQPFRSVAWTLLQLEIPFEVQLTVPGSKSKMGTQHDNFTQLTPHQSTVVPLLIYDSSTYTTATTTTTTADTKNQPVVLFESAAIMAHVCELSASTLYRNNSNSNGKSNNTATLLYPPPGTVDKAKVDAYLHWHHSNTRVLSKLFAVKVRPDIDVSDHPAALGKTRQRVHNVLQALETGWLQNNAHNNNNNNNNNNGNTCFLAGLPYPTIADILAYGELANVTMTHLIPLSDNDASSYPQLLAWMQQMEQLPHHQDVHQCLRTLGDLNDNNNNNGNNDTVPLEKRLAAATKAGLQGLQNAQKTYKVSTLSPFAKL